MEIFAGLSVATLVLTALAVVIKTFTLWLRSRQTPELLLTGMLLFATVIGYPFAIACNLIPARELPVIHVLYGLSMNIGFACLLLFTMKVFRPGVLWSKIMAGVLMLLLAGCNFAYIGEAIGENPRALIEMLGLCLFNISLIAVAYFWNTFESLSYYRRLRLQLRLGLVEVHVVDRVFLWGMMSLVAGIAVVFNCITIFTNSFMSPPVVAISSAFGIALASCLFLAFHPPGWYRAWAERRYAGQVG